MKDDAKKPFQSQSSVSKLGEIRDAHSKESGLTSEAICNETVDQLQSRSSTSIFARNLTPEELREKHRKRLEAMTALKVVFNVFEKWQLDNKQVRALLGNSDDQTYRDLQCRAVWSLPEDTLMRISYVLGIYKALRTIFPTEERASAWVHKSNKAFADASALDVMLSGGLATVRKYLDSQCHDCN